jgi:hypothetical protein
VFANEHAAAAVGPMSFEVGQLLQLLGWCHAWVLLASLQLEKRTE